MGKKEIRREEEKTLRELVAVGAIQKIEVHQSLNDKFYVVFLASTVEYRLRTRRSDTDRAFSSIDAAARAILDLGVNRFETVMSVTPKQQKGQGALF